MRNNDLTLIRLVLACIWGMTAVVSATVYPLTDSLRLMAPLQLPDKMAVLLVYGGAAADLLMAILTLICPHRRLWQLQIVLILVYTLLITLFMPEYWIHPFGPVLKNLAVLALLYLLIKYQGGADEHLSAA